MCQATRTSCWAFYQWHPRNALGDPHLVLGFLSPIRRYAPGDSHLGGRCIPHGATRPSCWAFFHPKMNATDATKAMNATDATNATDAMSALTGSRGARVARWGCWRRHSPPRSLALGVCLATASTWLCNRSHTALKPLSSNSHTALTQLSNRSQAALLPLSNSSPTGPLTRTALTPLSKPLSNSSHQPSNNIYTLHTALNNSHAAVTQLSNMSHTALKQLANNSRTTLTQLSNSSQR
jgi:hypothetical protein